MVRSTYRGHRWYVALVLNSQQQYEIRSSFDCMYYVFQESTRLSREKIIAVRHQITDEDLQILSGRSMESGSVIHPEDCPHCGPDFLEMLAKTFNDRLISHSPQQVLDNVCEYFETH